jgi:hypothetical protein
MTPLLTALLVYGIFTLGVLVIHIIGMRWISGRWKL